MIEKKIIYIWVAFFTLQNTFAQYVAPSMRKLSIGAAYSYNIPSADMSNRFGDFNGTLLGVYYKSKSQWTMGVSGTFYFGSQLKEDNLLYNLSNSSGTINSTNGNPAKYALSMHGYSVQANLGKMFRLFNRFPNSGLLVELSGGYISHWINFSIPQNDIPPLDDAHIKGYDRLSGGLAMTEFIGFMHYSASRFLNFKTGLSFTQANVQNFRQFNYDTQSMELGVLQDRISSFVFCWFIPIDISQNKDNEFLFR